MDTKSSLLRRWQDLKGRVPANRRAGACSAACAVFLGLLFLIFDPLGLRGWSYDFPFAVRAILPIFQPPVPTNDVVLVYMDENSHGRLEQPSFQDWNRQVHADLLHVLRHAGTRAVVFDILFEKPATNDEVLVRAISAHGRVFMGSQFVYTEDGVETTKLLPPTKALRDVVTSGVVEATEQDRVMRQHFRGDGKDLTLAWKVVEAMTNDPPADPFRARWMNYYGPPLALPHYSYVDVHDTNFPPGSFSNKVVFVGALPLIGHTGGRGAGTDTFITPYTHWSAEKTRSPGAEILATACLNLLRRDWLTELGPVSETLLILLTGVTLAFGLLALRPVVAVATAGGIAAGLAIISCLWAWYGLVWFPWMAIALVQVPVTLGGALLVNVSWLYREKTELEQKLATALSERPTQASPLIPGAPKIPMPPGRPAVGAGVAASPPMPAPAIPNHEMLRCIGKGAYGEVWLARDEIGSFHAVKIVHRSSFNDSGPFDREFRGIQQYTPISRTHHGLVHILHVGRNKEAGYFFYIMELGDCELNGQAVVPETYCAKNLGRELDKRGKLSVKECVHLAMELAEALHYLHSKQLIHRDIKPSNIIFVNNLPKFADVGLVTHVAEKGRDVTYLGTEGFIAPEGPGTPAADVYSLGKVLYEACMGRSAAQYPELPTSLTHHEELDELLELNKIILKACDQDPSRRYKTSMELQHDLMRLNDRLYGGAQRAHP